MKKSTRFQTITMRSRKVKVSHRADILLLAAAVILLTFGVVTVYNASLVTAHEFFGGKYHFLMHQLVWIFLGLIVAVLFYIVDYRRLEKIFSSGFWASLLTLFVTSWYGLAKIPVIGFFFSLLVNIPFYDILCPERNGARRWFMLNPEPLPMIPLLGRVGFQPTEMLKFFLIGVLAFRFSRIFPLRNKVHSLFSKGSIFFTTIKLCLLLVIILSLILLQPDFGSAFLVGSIGLGLFFIAGAPLLYFLLILPLGISASFFLIYLSPYRRERLLTFLGQGTNPLGSGYQINQVLIALGSGGLLGLGFGNSRQKYGYIPEVATDSIFSVIGEEMGWVGSVIFLGIFGLLLWRGILISKRSPDLLGQFLSSGIIIWIGLQALLNLAAVTAVIPFTGLPLPLVSYGGSSLIFILASLGILLNISKEG